MWLGWPPGLPGGPVFAAALVTPNVTATTTTAPSESSFRSILITSFLEPHVLQGLRRAPVQRGGGAIVSAPRREVALGRPGDRAMAGGRELRQAQLGLGEGVLRLVEPVLFEQRTAEHDLRVPDLVEEVSTSVEQLERVTRLLLGERPVAGAEVNLGE